MTPDLLEGKETVLSESDGVRLTTVDFDKVAVPSVVDVTARVEMSGVEAFVSVIVLNLEVLTSVVDSVISVVLFTNVETLVLDIKGLVDDGTIELLGPGTRVDTVRLGEDC